MGQNPLQPGLQQWQRHPSLANIFVNSRTQDEAECWLVRLRRADESALHRRIQDHHNFVARILHSQLLDRPNQQQSKYYVYVDHLYPLAAHLWVPITSALSILKGFRRLSSSYGLMRVSLGMVRGTSKKQIRVWINENIFKNQVQEKAESEEQMLADIVGIIMLYDSVTGALMVKCTKINEAINNILHHMTENKNVLHFSHRANHKDDKKPYDKDNTNVNKNVARSTKEAEDDSTRVLGHHIRYQPKHYPDIATSNYLTNVRVQRTPMYINTQVQSSPNKNNYVGFRKASNEGSSNASHSHHQPGKPNSIQFNNSQTIKSNISTRPYKGVEQKHEGHQSPNTSGYDRPVQSTSKFKSFINKPISNFNYFPGRQSNLNQGYMERLEASQESEPAYDTRAEKGSTQANPKSEQNNINTSREFSQKPSITTNKSIISEPSGAYHDPTRTKTQQFYKINEPMGYSPRVRTNYIQASPKLGANLSGVNISSSANRKIMVQPGQEARTNRQFLERQPSPGINTDEQAREVVQTSEFKENEKKQQKQRQVQTIKQEMNCLGILNSPKTLTTDKSARDLLIKKKVEQKNKKHEELKFAITKLLND